MGTVSLPKHFSFTSFQQTTLIWVNLKISYVLKSSVMDRDVFRHSGRKSAYSFGQANRAQQQFGRLCVALMMCVGRHGLVRNRNAVGKVHERTGTEDWLQLHIGLSEVGEEGRTYACDRCHFIWKLGADDIVVTVARWCQSTVTMLVSEPVK